MKVFIIGLFFVLSGLVSATEQGSCHSDFDCESLCCHSDSGTCAPHNPQGNLFCNKAPGEMCVASDFCQKFSVVECKIVKAGTNADGTVACTLRCPTVMKKSRCVDYVCETPLIPPVPDFDPRDCSKAVDP